ncbi:hypothetical protein [Rurimicrobium arvi]|uniref:Transglycosylase SLT domain-containing protein n=1 Tax=Rurimicrobium arvi TaxID=2049916 RepID=A0ABP8N017_9BACT
MALRTQVFPSINAPCPFSLKEMHVFLNRIKSNWLPYFRQAAQITGLPLALLVAKSAVESGGNQKTANINYVGLMQVGRNTISDCLDYLQGKMHADGRKWVAPAALISGALPVIRRSFPQFGNGGVISKDAAFALARSDTAAGAEFNVLMGAIYLQFLCQNPKFHDGEVLRLDKVMSAYNTGPNYGFYKTPVADTGSLVRIIGDSSLSAGKKLETSRHILKFCGIGGAFDLLFNNKFSLN